MITDLFSVFGVQVSLNPQKDLPFASTFQALGVLVNLEAVREGSFEVTNKPGRLEALEAEVAAVRNRGLFSAPEAATLKGRFQYADAQLFGKIAMPALRVLSQRAHRSGGCQVADDEILGALDWLVKHVLSSPPRRVLRASVRPPLLVLTDGACEGQSWESVTIGGILLDPEDGTVEYFGCRVPERTLLTWWAATGPRQTIGQAELLPAVMARRHWMTRIAGRRIFFFLDNNSARDALVRGDSAAASSRALLRAFYRIEARAPCTAWFTRVATAANAADGPSRLSFAWAGALPGAVRVHPHLDFEEEESALW